MTSTPTLDLVPLARLGEWCRFVEDAPPASQTEALAEADALRERGRSDDDSWRVLSAYRALVALALEGPRADVRATFMTREDPARDATTRRFAEAASHSPGDAGARAEVVLAECDTHAGLHGAAERRLRALWPSVRGTETAAEVWTCNALSELFVAERRELEGLTIARCGEAAADVAPGLEPVDVAHARAAVARALFALGDTPRLLAHLPRCLAAAAALAPTDAGRARFHAHLLVARSAIDGGEFGLARRHIALAEVEHRTDPGVVGHRGHAIASARARLDREERDVDGLRQALADIPPAPPTDLARLAARAGLEAAECVLAGDLAAATACAGACLARLDGAAERRQLSPSSRLHEADAIARLALDGGLSPRIVDDALRIAADAAYERLVELGKTERDLPALGTCSDDDLRALADYRTRFVGRHAAVLTRLRDRLEASARAGTLASWAKAGTDGLTTVCAWCLSLRDAEGTWLPLGHLFPTTPGLPVTHGICGRCRIEG